MSRSSLARATELPFALDVERASKELARLKDVDRVKDIADKAAAVRGWLRAQGFALEAQNDAAEIMIRAQRRAGEILRAMPKALGARNVGKSGGSKLQPPTLEEQGIEKTWASRAQKLAAVPEPVFEKHVTATRARAEKLTTSGAIAATSHVKGYDGDEHYTPSQYVEAGRDVLGGTIDLDVASNPTAQKTVRAVRYLTKTDDALSEKNRIWRGRLWVQPPYSMTGLFVTRLIENLEAGHATSAVCLLNADTGTSWFQELGARGLVCLPKGRIAFLGPDGKPRSGNRAAQVFFALGEASEGDLFEHRFQAFGLVGRLRGPT